MPDQHFHTNPPSLCSWHKLRGMLTFKQKCCYSHSECKNEAMFGCIESPRELFCRHHKSENMMIVSSCQYRGCKKHASWAFPFSQIVKRKSRLRNSEMTVTHNCSNPMCDSEAAFFSKGQVSQYACNQHCLPSMLPLVKGPAPCLHSKKCKSQASFGFAFPGQLRKQVCEVHRLPGMIYLCRRLCEMEGCKRTAKYGMLGEVFRRRCESHKLPGMGDMFINRPGCVSSGCTERPEYNYSGFGIPVKCFLHKVPAMVKCATRSLFCEQVGCKKRGLFSPPYDETKRRFCWQHKQPGMVCLSERNCTGSPTCLRKPRFGDPKVAGLFGRAVQFCSIHRMPDSVDVLTPKCQHRDCTEFPSFRHKKIQGKIFCDKHKANGMLPIENLVQTRAPFKRSGKPVYARTRKLLSELGKYCADHYNQFSKTMEFCQRMWCGRAPAWAEPGQTVRQFCGNHRTEGMVFLKIKRFCEMIGCPKEPTYNFALPGAARRFCAAHKLPSMVEIGSKVCETEGCSKRARYNFPGIKKKRFCFSHKLPEMCRKEKTLRGQAPLPQERVRCIESGCLKRPVYLFFGDPRPTYCPDHRRAGMIGELRARTLCEVLDCQSMARFNFREEAKGRFCNAHKMANMVNFFTKICQEGDCGKSARYNYPQNKYPKFCSEHCQEGMEVVFNGKYCEAEGCSKLKQCLETVVTPGTPSGLHGKGNTPMNLTIKDEKNKVFAQKKTSCAYQGCERKGIFYEFPRVSFFYCEEHKTPRMVSFLTKLCHIQGCYEYGNYVDRKEAPRLRRCKAHSLPELMKTNTTPVCEHLGCDLFPRFNFPGNEKSRFCSDHKITGMVLILPRQCCKVKGCKQTAFFRHEKTQNAKAERCSIHTEEGMIDLRNYCRRSGCNEKAQPIDADQPGFCSQHKNMSSVDAADDSNREMECVVSGCVRRQKLSGLCGQHLKRTKHKLKQGRDPSICQKGECTRKALFNFRGELRGIYCRSHKENGMVNLITCRYEGCPKYPSFNYPNFKKREFCKDHKLDGMVMKCTFSLCQEEGCPRSALYNFPTSTKKIFCANHKLEGMESMHRKGNTCKVDGCSRQGCYNFPGASGKRYCGDHKIDGMVCKAYRPCEISGCTRKPYYRYQHEVEVRCCVQHKNAGMVFAKNQRTCEIKMCESKATCKFPVEKKRRRCSAHIIDGMIDYSKRRN